MALSQGVEYSTGLGCVFSPVSLTCIAVVSVREPISLKAYASISVRSILTRGMLGPKENT